MLSSSSSFPPFYPFSSPFYPFSTPLSSSESLSQFNSPDYSFFSFSIISSKSSFFLVRISCSPVFSMYWLHKNNNLLYYYIFFFAFNFFISLFAVEPDGIKVTTNSIISFIFNPSSFSSLYSYSYYSTSYSDYSSFSFILSSASYTDLNLVSVLIFLTSLSAA